MNPSDTPPPPLAERLSYAGLAPFVLGALLVWLVTPEEAHAFAAMLLLNYAGMIVAFMGAMLWGLALRVPLGTPVQRPALSPWVWGVSAALLAWVGTLMPPYAGLVVQGVLLIACYAMDRRLYPRLGASGWLTLRFRLTAVASLCCFLGAAGC
jgi:hypothetical protein